MITDTRHKPPRLSLLWGAVAGAALVAGGYGAGHIWAGSKAGADFMTHAAKGETLLPFRQAVGLLNQLDGGSRFYRNRQAAVQSARAQDRESFDHFVAAIETEWGTATPEQQTGFYNRFLQKLYHDISAGGTTDMVQHVENKFSSVLTQDDFIEALNEAVLAKNMENVIYFLESDRKIPDGMPEFRKSSTLFYALHTGSLDIADLLFQKGFRIEKGLSRIITQTNNQPATDWIRARQPADSMILKPALE